MGKVASSDPLPSGHEMANQPGPANLSEIAALGTVGGSGELPPVPPSAGPGGGGPNWDAETLLSQMRAAGGELSVPGRFEEISTVLDALGAAQAALESGYLVDAAQSPFAGLVIMERGTERINFSKGKGGMGLDHIIERHAEEFQKKVYGDNFMATRNNFKSVPQETFDIVMNAIRTGSVVDQYSSSGGAGTTFTVQTSWSGVAFEAKVTINSEGEVIQANPV